VSAQARESVAAPAGFGYGVLVATLGCALIALPAALRSGAPLPLSWLALWGSAALMAAPVAGAWRVARPLPASAWCLPLGVALSLAPLMVFARLLKTATHHRPLGGATFAIVAALLVLGATAVAARLLAWSGQQAGAKAKLPVVVALLGSCLAVPLALPMLGAELRGALLDGVLLLGVTALGALVPEQRRIAARAAISGPLLWIGAIGSALAVGLGSAATRAALADHAPVLLGLAGWLRP